MPVNRVMARMIAYLGKAKGVEHSLKVFAYAVGIGGGEGLGPREARILAAAALLHDIGIPAALEKHGSHEGRFQEMEGERIVPGLLERADFPPEDRERVAWLVGHHHQEALAPSDPLLQILMEADYLVNLSEGNLPGVEPRVVLDTFFRTGTGRDFMRAVYSL